MVVAEGILAAAAILVAAAAAILVAAAEAILPVDTSAEALAAVLEASMDTAAAITTIAAATSLRPLVTFGSATETW
jgi:hypothetical protein